MSLHNEIQFERDICHHLAAHGWLYAEGDAKGYDTPRAIFPADVLAWVQATQPQAWEALTKSHGAAAEATLLDRVRKQLDDRGTLEVLRFGVELLGLASAPETGPVQTRTGHEPGVAGPVCRQPAARGAAGPHGAR